MRSRIAAQPLRYEKRFFRWLGAGLEAPHLPESAARYALELEPANIFSTGASQAPFQRVITFGLKLIF